MPFSLLSQNSTPTLWDSLEEPDIRDTSEFEYLFSKDTTQQKKKPLSETYEKKNKVKKVLTDYSDRYNYIYIYIYIHIFYLSYMGIHCVPQVCFSSVFKKYFGRFRVTDDSMESIVWEICTCSFGRIVWIFSYVLKLDFFSH